MSIIIDVVIIIFVTIFFFFSEWLLAKGLPVRFEELSVEDLAKQLLQFYAEVRQRNGKPYSRSGLINIRASIQRYLASPPFNKTFNIMKDREFSAANQVIQGTIKVMREAGLDTTQHKLAVQKEDMAKIRQNMNMDTPKGLQDKVFIDIVLQFARHGREGLRELTKHSFVINRDAAGRLYATPAYNEQQKNHNGQNPKVHDPRKVMYEQAGDPKCPVKALQMCLSKLHPDCEAFFQRPKSKYSRDGIWYDNVPVGKNLLSSKMSRISREAGCSEVYTNHCLRATATTVLAHAGIEHNDICAVTGHRSVDTIRQYVKEPSMDQRANMSKILHDYGSSSSTDLALCPVSTTEEAATPSTSTESTSGAVSSANSENAVVPQTLSVYSNQNSKTAVNSLLSGNNFYGTVNFYLNNWFWRMRTLLFPCIYVLLGFYVMRIFSSNYFRAQRRSVSNWEKSIGVFPGLVTSVGVTNVYKPYDKNAVIYVLLYIIKIVVV